MARLARARRRSPTRRWRSAYAARTSRAESERDAYAAIFTRRRWPRRSIQRWSVWAAGFGGSQTTDGNAALGSNNTTSRIAGTAVGADYRFSPYTIAGFALAGGGTNFSVANGGSGRSDLFQAGAFVRHTVGPAYISGALAYGWQDVTTNRTVTIAGIDQLHARVQRQRVFRPRRRRLSLRHAVDGRSASRPMPPDSSPPSICRPMPSRRSSAPTPLRWPMAPRSVTDTRSELGIRTDKSFAMHGRHPHAARPRRLGA